MAEIPTLREFQGTSFSLPTIGTKRGEYMCVLVCEDWKCVRNGGGSQYLVWLDFPFNRIR